MGQWVPSPPVASVLSRNFFAALNILSRNLCKRVPETRWHHTRSSGTNRERCRKYLERTSLVVVRTKGRTTWFRSEQRRIIRGTGEKQICARCKNPLSWSDYSVEPHPCLFQGGKTSLKECPTYAQALQQSQRCSIESGRFSLG